MDIGFSELVLLVFVAFLVLGPKRLPEMVRSFFYYQARIKKFLQKARWQFEQEVGVDEIRLELASQDLKKGDPNLLSKEQSTQTADLAKDLEEKRHRSRQKDNL